MAIIIHTAEVSNLPPLGETQGLWLYNALDCCVTLEVLHAIRPQLNEITSVTYQRALDLQAPILEMECRGIRFDKAASGAVVVELSRNLDQLYGQLLEILRDGIGLAESEIVTAKKEKGVLVQKYLWNSPAQLKELFYECMGIPAVKNRGSVTVNRKALEKLRGNFYAQPIVNHILAIRDTNKKLGVLRTGIDRDERMRTSFNIAGTDTGRLSSYVSSFGTGTNLQNITGSLRKVFIADPGMKLGYVDLEQAESRAVGAIMWNLFQDGRYLDACESGDLHTLVTMLCWQNLAWPFPVAGKPVQALIETMRHETLAKAAKAVAKAPFYRHFDYRDGAKRLGHATNYFGQPPHIAKEVNIPLPFVQEFQSLYLPAFGLSAWHQWVKQKIIRDGWITTFMGRQRWFHGRRFDAETLRSGIAYEPQSVIADILNGGMLKVWRESLEGRLPVQLLLQVHDAIVFQFPEELEFEIVPKVQRLLEVEIPLMHGRSMTIPTEAFTGWNWAYAENAKKETINPDGLRVFGADQRKRSTPIKLMDRRFY